MGKPTLCVDFDGCVHSFTSGWQGVGAVADEPVPGAIEWLRSALEHFDVAIYSSRSKEQKGVEAMRLWLSMWAFERYGPHDLDWLDEISFPTEKPGAFLTIDDRAICFDGDFSVLDPETLLQFKPWNRGGESDRQRAERVEAECERLRDALQGLLNVIAADALIPESVSYMQKAREALATPPPESEPERHQWRDERCVKCGDKDWRAGPVCPGAHPTPEQTEVDPESGLKPCPFCGGRAILRTGEECAIAQCLAMSAHRLIVGGDNDAANEVTQMWNMRPEPPQTGDALALFDEYAERGCWFWNTYERQDAIAKIRAALTASGVLYAVPEDETGPDGEQLYSLHRHPPHGADFVTVRPPQPGSGVPYPINVVFDGPPSAASGRFVEVETDDGYSVRVGEWIERKDGLWSLRIDCSGVPYVPPVTQEMVDEINSREGWSGFTLDDLRMIRDALASAPADGWKLVPVEPTEEMMEEYRKAFVSSERFDGAAVYRAMVSAAPTHGGSE